MTAADQRWVTQFLKNASLISLSLIVLPQDTVILFFNSVVRLLGRDEATRRRRFIRGTATPYFEPKTILVTGVGMSKGLTLARQFYAAGHNVIGADFEPIYAPNPGRVSKTIQKFYRLGAPAPESGSRSYVQTLLDIITQENVQLWVSCSGVASAVEDGEAKETIERLTSCKAVQFDAKTTQLLHEKHSFIAHTASLGLNVPETHTITSQNEALNILDQAEGKQYILKSLVLDDANRGDMTSFPRPSHRETEKHLANLRISPQTPWILQQYIHGSEYCTHALVIRGKVRAFVACPSAELLMHYEALPHESPLTQAMLDFTCEFSEKQGEAFTGHLSFDFLVAEDEMAELKRTGRAGGAKVNLWPIECNPRAHTAVVLFDKNSDMVGAYLDLLEGPKDAYTHQKQPGTNGVNGPGLVNGETASPIVWPAEPQKYYWSGHDFVTLVILPFLSYMKLYINGEKCSSSVVLEHWKIFFNHLLFWKDGTFEMWDPWPWWWLHHVYWPLLFAYYAFSGKRWSRMNVSTGKVFEY